MINILFFVLFVLFPVVGLSQQTNIEKAYNDEVNILKNPGFELGLTDYAKTGSSTLTKETTDVALGSISAKWDASASGEFFQSSLVTIPNGLYGRNCQASFLYKSDTLVAGDIKLQAHDGTNKLSEVNLNPTSGRYSVAISTFQCPLSGSVRLRIESFADTPIIYLDDLWLGTAKDISSLSVQASFYGKAQFVGATSCEWSRTSTTYGDFTADTDCANPTVTGKVLAPDTKIPGIKLSADGAGRYKVAATFPWEQAVSSISYCRLVDDLGNVLNEIRSETGASSVGRRNSTLLGEISYASPQTRVVYIQCKSSTGAVGILNSDATASNMWFHVWKYPTNTVEAVNLETQEWYVDATIDDTNSYSQIFSGSGSSSTPTQISDTDLTLTNRTGSNSNTKIACSGAEATGTTCAGNELQGITVTIPFAGKYLVCFEYDHYISYTANTGRWSSHLVRTADGSSTIIENLNTSKSFGYLNVTSAIANAWVPSSMCAVSVVNTSGIVSYKLYETHTSNNASNEGRIYCKSGDDATKNSCRWTIIPVNQNFPQAVALSKAPTNNCANGETICSGLYTPATGLGTTSCTSPSYFESQYTRIGNVVTGGFKIDINCTVNQVQAVTIPIASNFTSDEDATGSCVCSGSSCDEHLSIQADTTNDELSIQNSAAGTGTQTSHRCTFSYKVK